MSTYSDKHFVLDIFILMRVRVSVVSNKIRIDVRVRARVRVRVRVKQLHKVWYSEIFAAVFFGKLF